MLQRFDKSRSLLQDWIKRGFVTVDGKVITKPGVLIDHNAEIEIHLNEPEYVSRAGLKLHQALHEFSIDVAGLTVLDAGLSTGGFADCLLQRGAAHVYGVEVGTNQLHESLQGHDRLTVCEQTDIRMCLGKFPLVDMVTLDLSFISILKVIDVVERLLKPAGLLLVLIKPQFETEKTSLNRKGIVKTDFLRKKIVNQVLAGMKNSDFVLQGIIESTISGKDGNKEFLAYFKKGDAHEDSTGHHI